ncbi:MAG: ATPase domain-containing protein [Patescibacteria group bacterium]
MKKKNKKEITRKLIFKDGSRVPTGIPGFDALIQGGFPRNSNILIAGIPGTGKSIFGMQFLYNGTTLYNEKGLYVTFEQKREDVIKQAKQFGWDFEDLEKRGKLRIMNIPINKINDRTANDIRIIIIKERVKRVVIDSLSTLVVNAPLYMKITDIPLYKFLTDKIVLSQPIIGDFFVKKFIYEFVDTLKGFNCTSLLIGEAPQNAEYLTRDTISEFICDGVIVINFESLGGNYSRSLIIRKMRQTKNDEDVHPVEISSKGIVVHKIE